MGVDNSRVVQIPNYFDMAEKSIHVVVKHVQAARKDFYGGHMTFDTTYHFNGFSTGWKTFLAVPLRQVDSVSLVLYYIGQIFATFTRIHNLTFETNSKRMTGYELCRQWTVQLGFGLSTDLQGSSWHGLLASFRHFSEFKTLMSSELISPSPYTLSSLGTPWNGAVACLVLSTACLVGLLLFLSKPGAMKKTGMLRAFHIFGTLFSSGILQQNSSKLLLIV